MDTPLIWSYGSISKLCLSQNVGQIWYLRMNNVKSKVHNQPVQMCNLNWVFGFHPCYLVQFARQSFCLYKGLMLSMLGKNSTDNIMKYFASFCWKIGFDNSCKLSPNRIWHFMHSVSYWDNLHEMSNPLLWGKIRTNITSLSSAEFVYSMLLNWKL